MLPDNETLVTTGMDGMCRFHPLPRTPFLSKAGISEIPVSEREAKTTRGSQDGTQWAFLRTMLVARFHGEIEICPLLDIIGCYDIQIVG
jgi:hypothetical protein